MTQFTSKNESIISNEQLDFDKIVLAQKIINDLQNELQNYVNIGHGPFLAAIYDDKGNLISKCANSVVNDACSNCHAEINTIKEAERKLGTYDLSRFNLSIYVTSEPCMMCLGAILWSGIKEVYYGVQSKDVEAITGYDEGFKPNWFEEFAKRGISTYGNIEADLGKKVLKKYVRDGHVIYKPLRK